MIQEQLNAIERRIRKNTATGKRLTQEEFESLIFDVAGTIQLSAQPNIILAADILLDELSSESGAISLDNLNILWDGTTRIPFTDLLSILPPSPPKRD